MCRKSSLKWLNWYPSENYFSSFHFMEAYVANAGWIGWFAKILQNLFSKRLLLKYMCGEEAGWMVELDPSRKPFSRKSSFSKMYVLQSCLKDWIGLILENMCVEKARWNGWIDILQKIISLLSIFSSYTSRTLVELVDSRRFAKIIFRKVFF